MSEGSFRNDGTSDAYVPKGYPAVPDLELTQALVRAARVVGPKHELGVHAGLNVTDDAFYAESPAWTEQMSGLGLLNVEMESSALFVVARQRGLRAGMVCAVSSNLVAGTSVYDEEAHRRLAVGWGASVEAALEAIVELASDGPWASTSTRTSRAGSPGHGRGPRPPDGRPAPAEGWDAALRMREPADLTVYLGHVAAAYPVLARPSPCAASRARPSKTRRRTADYLEIRFRPHDHARPGSTSPSDQAACAGLDEGRRATGCRSGWSCAPAPPDEETNRAVARAALRRQAGRRGVRRRRRRAALAVARAVPRVLRDRGRGGPGVDRPRG